MLYFPSGIVDRIRCTDVWGDVIESKITGIHLESSLYGVHVDLSLTSSDAFSGLTVQDDRSYETPR